jgi:hypothetical protein
MTVSEAIERLRLIREYGRQERIETRKSQIALLQKFEPVEQAEIISTVKSMESSALSGGAK